jgi:ribonucleoside-diphosphate reductase beta chain
MAAIETVHSIAYEKLLVVLGLEDSFEQNLKLDIISGRVKYLRKYNDKVYTDKKKQYVYALTLFTLFVENVSLFSQFYVLLWIGRYKSALKDVNQQINYTMREELLHALTGVKLINVLRVEYPELFDEDLKKKILHEADESLKCESKIIDWMVGDYSKERINADILKEYVKYKLNDSLSQIGYGSPYKIDPAKRRDFEWMIEESLANNLTDFFHKRPVNYVKKASSFEPESLF